MSASSARSLGAGSASAASAATGSAPGEAASAAASAVSTAAAPGCATVLLAPGCIAAAPTGAFRPADSPSGLNKKIAELKAEQTRCLEQKKQLAKDLRNAERKRRRIKDRARQLTDEDLVAVLMMRKETKRSAAESVADGAALATRAEGAEAVPAPHGAETPDADNAGDDDM